MENQGVQQMQQPIVVYPNTYTKQYPNPNTSSSSSSSTSKGNFGTVFIVLAVIFVLSVMACAFGRLCNRGSRVDSKHLKEETKASSSGKKKSREIRPVEREPRERGDLEFGLRSKPIEKGFGEDVERSGPSIKHGVRFKLPENGDDHGQGKGEIRQGGPVIELRPRQ